MWLVGSFNSLLETHWSIIASLRPRSFKRFFVNCLVSFIFIWFLIIALYRPFVSLGISWLKNSTIWTLKRSILSFLHIFLPRSCIRSLISIVIKWTARILSQSLTIMFFVVFFRKSLWWFQVIIQFLIWIFNWTWMRLLEFSVSSWRLETIRR